MTSNLGADFLVNQPEGEDTDGRDQVMGIVRSAFRPEFLNRVDESSCSTGLKEFGDGPHRRHPDGRLQKLLDDRKISITLDPKRARMAGGQRLGPGLWRAAAQAGDPEGGAGSACRNDPGRPIKDGETVTVSAGKSGLTFNGKLAQAA